MDDFGAIEQPIGRITSGIQTGTLILKTIDFVQQHLSAWRDDPDRPEKLSEPSLNQQLVKFLDSRARNDFPMVRFDHEEQEPKRRSVDFSASPSPFEAMVIGERLHTIYDPFLVFECKRLPPPPSKDREIEYVTGGKNNKSGGIQRFKLGLHGAKLNMVGMIGYVQERSTVDWYRQINSWISELASGVREDCCIWKDSEQLQEFNRDERSGIANCRSVHDRIGNVSSSELIIHHLWVAMNLKKTQRNSVINKAGK